MDTRSRNPRLGVCEKALPASLPWERTFETVARIGYGFYELSIDESAERRARLQWSNAERTRVHRVASGAGVDIMTVGLSAHRAVPWGSPDPAVRARAAQLADASMGLASDLGARCVQVAGYYTYYEIGHEESRRWFVDGLATAARVARDRGLVLALENVDGTDVVSVHDALGVLRDVGSPAVRLYVDVGNLVANDLDVASQLELALPNAFAVQLKDARPGVFRRVPFGTGTVPFSQVLETCTQASYRGPLSIEMWNDHDDPLLALSAFDFVTRAMREPR